MLFFVGDLVKWISDWKIYSADSCGVHVNGEVPIYSHGIVIESYMDRKILVVFCNETRNRQLINLELTECDVVSRTKKKKWHKNFLNT